MSNEAQIRTSLFVKKDNLQYQSDPTAFSADVAGTKGPSPGYVLVPITGIDIDFSELSSPSLCNLQNYDTVNYVEYGTWNGATFYPLGELLPGEVYTLRLSRNLRFSEGVGTGTIGSGNKFRMKAHGASCGVRVEAFDL